MRVKLINYTPKALLTVFTAARTCYSPDFPTEIWRDIEEGKVTGEKIYALIDTVIGSGHLSVLEHISFTFSIEGISRACSHQLVRHRIASYSQQSQRYVEIQGNQFVRPPTIENNPEAREIFESVLEQVLESYRKLIELKIPAEDARFILPNATKTNLVMTMNFRELYNVCQIRLCNRAQWEIRELFWRIKYEISSIHELSGLAEHLQPRCVIFGFCPEHKSCGFYPSRNEVIGGTL